jgi:hypothetical protein
VDHYHLRGLIDERAVDFADIMKENPRILECFDLQGWTDMLTVLGDISMELVREFYSNIFEYGDGYFRTWLRSHEIRVTPELINTLAGTPSVPESAYPWTSDDRPSKEVMLRSFMVGSPTMPP